jgi:hypothetical protein
MSSVKLDLAEVKLSVPSRQNRTGIQSKASHAQISEVWQID